MSGAKNSIAPLVSVVVSTKNRLSRLTVLLDSLERQTYPSLETIVVDDGSEPALPPLKVSRQVRNEHSLGMCGARNNGMLLAHGQYIVVLDDDTCLSDSTLLERAVERAQQWPRLGAIGFRELTPDGRVHYMQPAKGDELCRASRFFGYGFLMTREAVQHVGGFYGPLGYYQEETELGLRLLDAGYTLLYDPGLRLIHYEEAANRNHRVIQRQNFRNLMCTVLLRYPSWLVVPSLIRALLQYLRLTLAWKIFSFSDTAWAFRSLIQMYPGLMRDRKPVRYATLRDARAANLGNIALGDPAPAQSPAPAAPR
jgi:GT2 family glycosyltransferase